MLYSLRGTLLHTESGSVAVECGGVGYLCQTTLSTLAQLPSVGSEVFVYTYMHFRQDNVDLFAFLQPSELNCFKMLLGVSGVGPKVALSLLSSMTSEQVAMSVATGDYKTLTQAPGVGPKLAQRIVLELRDKVKKMDVLKGTAQQLAGVPQVAVGNAGEAISALAVLGFSHGEAAEVVSRMDPALSVEDMIKAGLKQLAGH